MAVAGSGKTTVGMRLAEVRCEFFDGDDYHLAASLEKQWEGAVIARSALKGAHRKRLMPHDAGLAGSVRLLCLSIPAEEARRRLFSRPGRFMPAMLVASRFEALQEPVDTCQSTPSGRPVRDKMPSRQRLNVILTRAFISALS